MTPLRPSSTTIGKSTRERPTARSKSPPGIAERLDQERRDQDEERGEAAEDEEHEPEDRRRDAPGALAVALLDQVAEDGDERARERRVGEQGADEVRDLERDRERVDLAVDAEVVGRDHLAHEAEDAGEAGRDREDQRRAREPAVLAAAAQTPRRALALQRRSCRSSSARTRSPPSHERGPRAARSAEASRLCYDRFRPHAAGIPTLEGRCRTFSNRKSAS